MPAPTKICEKKRITDSRGRLSLQKNVRKTNNGQSRLSVHTNVERNVRIYIFVFRILIQSAAKNKESFPTLRSAA